MLRWSLAVRLLARVGLWMIVIFNYVACLTLSPILKSLFDESSEADQSRTPAASLFVPRLVFSRLLWAAWTKLRALEKSS